MIIRCHQTGKDAAGLTRYLFGPGKANEHVHQRMVAGSPELAGEWSGAELSAREATHLGVVVEAAWRRQYAPALALAGAGSGGISHANLVAADDSVPGQGHVFHASLSLGSDEPALSDEQWQEVAEAYVAGMGFTGAEGRPDCSWFAVNHGPSKEGNDHIHIVVCATRADGSRADLHNTGRRSQTIRREVLEKFDYVTQLHEAERDQATPSLRNYTAAEHNMARERAARGQGPATPDRVRLQRIVRAAATTATTEAEFVNNVCKNPRMEIEAARWEPGTDQQVVTGYKIRFKGGTWFSASKLSPDLTLGKLRPQWTGETDASRSYARALWAEQVRPEKRGETPDAPAHLEQAARELESVNAALEQLDPRDVASWNHVEAATAGASAVIATAAPAATDEFGRETGLGVDAGRAADALTRQWLADNYNHQPAAMPRVPQGLSRTEAATRHIQLAVRAASTDRHAGWIAVIQQLARTVEALARAKEARRELVSAERLRRDAGSAMGRLEEWLGTHTSPELSPAAAAARAAAGHAIDRGRPAEPTQTSGTDARIDRADRTLGRRGRGPRR